MLKSKILTNCYIRFLIGLFLLGIIVAFFSSGWFPPGVCGAVLRHNAAEDLDASPLFYSEVENMSELENGITQIRKSEENETNVKK
ncbi:MAG: hypothetical protein GF315_12300 [candidate division Zixibacteria bacterium]|nr:hypothetical protein [candidate division Zixibacteria bacterium]